MKRKIKTVFEYKHRGEKLISAPIATIKHNEIKLNDFQVAFLIYLINTDNLESIVLSSKKSSIWKIKDKHLTYGPDIQQLIDLEIISEEIVEYKKTKYKLIDTNYSIKPGYYKYSASRLNIWARGEI